MTNETIINRFLNHLRRDGKSVLTLSAYATDLKQFFCLAKTDPAPQDIFSFLPDRLTNLCRHWTEGLAPNSRARKLTSIREFLRWCYQQGYITVDLSRSIDRPTRGTQTQTELLSTAHIARLRRRANPLERLLLELLLQTGMKLRDALSIKMKHVQLKNSLLHHPQSTFYYPLSGRLHQALSYYLESKNRRPSGLLLTSPRGKRLSVRTASNLLANLSKKARVRHATPRDLRAAFIVRQLEAGTSPDVIRQAIGLHTIASLQKYLAHSRPIPHNEKIVLANV